MGREGPDPAEDGEREGPAPALPRGDAPGLSPRGRPGEPGGHTRLSIRRALKLMHLRRRRATSGPNTLLLLLRRPEEGHTTSPRLLRGSGPSPAPPSLHRDFSYLLTARAPPFLLLIIIFVCLFVAPCVDLPP